MEEINRSSHIDLKNCLRYNTTTSEVFRKAWENSPRKAVSDISDQYVKANHWSISYLPLQHNSLLIGQVLGVSMRWLFVVLHVNKGKELGKVNLRPSRGISAVFVKMKSKSYKRYAWPLLVLLASAMWGSSFVASKVCITSGMREFETIFYRFGVGALLIGILFRRQLRNLKKKVLISGGVLGVCNALACITEIYGLKLSDASKAAFLISINIVLFPFLYCAYYHLHLRLHTVAAAGLTLIGVGFLSLTNGFRSLTLGDLLLILTGVLYALGSLIMVVLCREESGIQVTFIQFIVIAAIMGALTLFQGSGAPFPPSAIMALAFLIIFPTVLCFYIKIESLKYLDPVLCTLLLSTESIFCAMISVLILHEAFTLRALIGAILISGGIVVESLHPVEPSGLPRDSAQ